jgi:NTP pyrophosphatase (non-canonical NTP hydrolase)
MEAVRDEVATFSLEMERILKKNDLKGGWHTASLSWLFMKLAEEFGEVGEEMRKLSRMKCELELANVFLTMDRLCDELVDVANVAMMIHDNTKRLKTLYQEEHGL